MNNTGGTTQQLRLTACSVDLSCDRMSRDGRDAPLTALEGRLLRYLVDRPLKDVSREELLDQVWSYRSHNATRAVDLVVGRLRKKIEQDPAKPDHLVSVFGHGYRFVPLVTGQSKALVRPITQAMTGDAFIGRDDDLAHLHSLFASGARIVTVHGPPGVGKTRLVREYASGVNGPTLSCDLTSSRTRQALCRVLASVLRITPTDAGTLEASISMALAAADVPLLVLDNFEQLVEHAALIAEWVEVSRVPFLVTSRERLKIRSERVLELNPLREHEGVALFRDRAQRASNHAFEEDDAVLSQIVLRLDGLPLAIELAAARATIFSPTGIRDQLSQRFRLLTNPGRDHDPRQATMHAAIAWSWDLLSEHERSAMAQSTVFRGSFALERAETILELAPEAPWLADVLESLRSKSLLTASYDTGRPRFRMLESIREFASLALSRDSDVERLRVRHACEMARFCGKVRADVPDHEQILALVAESDNVFAALERIDHVPDTCEAADLWLCASRLASNQGPGQSRALVRIADRLLERGLPETKRIDVLVRYGCTAYITGDYAGSETAFRQAVDLATRRGDSGSLATLLGHFAAFEAARAQWRTAGEYAAQGTALARELGDTLALAAHLRTQARVEQRLGNLATARAIYEQSRTVRREHSSPLHDAMWLVSVGLLERWVGNLERALANFSEGHDLATRQGAAELAAILLGNIGDIHVVRGELDEAERYLSEAMSRHQRYGEQRSIAYSHLTSGALQASRGAFDAAAREYATARRMVTNQIDPTLRCLVAAEWADLHLYDSPDSGSLSLVQELVEDARAVAEPTGDLSLLSRLIGLSSHVHVLAGAPDRDQELSAAIEAVAVLREHGFLYELAVASLRLGTLAHAVNRYDVARGALSEAEDLAVQFKVGPDSRLAKRQATLRDLIGEPQVRRVW